MDPNKTLRTIRLFIEQMKEHESVSVREAFADEITELFEALDEWLSRGGFLPTEWESAFIGTKLKMQQEEAENL